MYKVKRKHPDKIKYLTVTNLYTSLQIFHSYKNMRKCLLSIYICWRHYMCIYFLTYLDMFRGSTLYVLYEKIEVNKNKS